MLPGRGKQAPWRRIGFSDNRVCAETILDRLKRHICVISLEGANPEGVKIEPEP